MPYLFTNKCQDTDDAAASRQEVAKRVLQWRWLIIDEISMVSARLLAEMDVTFRGVVRDLGMQKRGLDNVYTSLWRPQHALLR